MVNVGIIGCGRITEYRHAPEYLENENVRLLGFVDTKPGQAQLMADKFGGKDYGSIDQMLADAQIDAVSVCVANTFHAEVTLAALRAGKHVLLEKPMAATLEACRTIAKQARTSNKIVMLGHNQRFAPAHIKAKELIAQGLIGRPLSFRTTFGHSGPEVWTHNPNSWFIHRDSAAFGVLGDLGIHKTDLIHFLLNEPIVEVSAQLSTLDKRYEDGSLIDLPVGAEMAAGEARVADRVRAAATREIAGVRRREAAELHRGPSEAARQRPHVLAAAVVVADEAVRDPAERRVDQTSPEVDAIGLHGR